MNNQPNDAQDTNTEAGIRRYNIALPLAALALDLLPVLLGFLGTRGIYIPMQSLLAILSPTMGLLTGIFALNQGKARIGLAGKIIAIVAIALPLGFVAFIIIILIGATTGLIPLM